MSELERLNDVLKFVFLKIGIYKKADMAEFLGYKSPYFSGIINGKEKLTEQFLKNISDKLGVNIDYILEGKGEMLKNYQKLEKTNSSVAIGRDANGSEIHITSQNVEEFIRITEKYQEHTDKMLAIIEKLINK
jgi:transcriptional regulator with XRE-family HTH domain